MHREELIVLAFDASVAARHSIMDDQEIAYPLVFGCEGFVVAIDIGGPEIPVSEQLQKQRYSALDQVNTG